MSQETFQDPSLSRPKILIVDDEVAMVRSLELLLRPLGQVYKSYSVPEAEEELSEHKIDCVITDVSMPEASGIELLDRVRKSQPDIPVIIMTAYSSVPEAVEAIQLGAFEYLTKPFENTEMLETVRRAIERKGLVTGKTEGLPEGWVCTSPAMKEFLLRAEKLAHSQSPVLIVGQKGVGKRRAGRWIFEQSCEEGQGFEVFSATELNRQGVDASKEVFSSAKVVFVEEIYSLSPELQDFVFDQMRSESVRVLASTTSSPSVQSPTNFRQDLHALLNAHILSVPSLNERAGDFEALCFQILNEIRERMKMKKLDLDPQALETLKNHHWVENVRELENSLERAAMESKSQRILSEDLRFELPDLSQLLPFSIPVEEGWGRMEFLFKSLEKDLIGRALERYPEKSNSQIATLLGTTRRILELRMKSYDLRGDSK